MKEKQDIEEKKHKKGWKIPAILSLVVILVGLIIVGTKIFEPALPTEPGESVINKNDSIFTVTLTRNQLNHASEEYMDKFLKNDDIKYQFTVDKKHANVLGKVKFLGSKVDFKLILDPSVRKNGDIRLKARTLKLGTLPVPLSFVMSYIDNSYHLPTWVKMNSKKHIIDLKLTQYKTKTGYSIKANKFDLANNKIKIEVFKKGQ